MGTRHPKSPCCQASVQHFGGRRRRCRQCGRTWSLYPHRRGRKRRRPTATVVVRTIDERRALRYQPAPPGLSASAVHKRFQAALRWWLAHSAPPAVPAGPLILLIDAVWCTFAHQDWTVYLVAFKPLRAPRAYFVDPLVLPGHESARDWAQVLDRVPPEVATRIVAMVSDGFRGSHTLARRRGWLHQRCHFHLIAQLHERRGRHLRLPAAPGDETLYEAIRLALVTDSPRVLRERLRYLRAAAVHPTCPRRVRMMVQGFLRHVDAFRCYKRNPGLHLPTTTNVVESMVRRLRDRIRTLSTPAAVQRWAVAAIRLRPILTCNGHDNQPN